MPREFWGIAAKQARAKGFSKARIDYIVDRLMTSHSYPTITLADIFAIDKEIHFVNYDEYMTLTIPHRPLAEINFAGKKRVVYRDEAERCGYECHPILSHAEKEEKQRLLDDMRYKKEMSEIKTTNPNKD